MARTEWWFAGLVGLALLAGCAELVGLTGDYTEEKAPDSGGTGGSLPPLGGEGGEKPQGGNAGHAGDPAGRGGGGMTGGTGNVGGASGGNPSGGNPSGGDAGTGVSGGSGPGGAGAGGSAGAGSTRPSCEGLPASCGLDADTDCCAASPVQGDTYDRDNDARYPATIGSFFLDDFEISVGRFRNFVAAFDDGYRPEPGSGKNPKNEADPGWKAEWTALLPPDKAALVGSDEGVTCIDSNWPKGFWTWTDEPGQNERRPMNCLNWYLAYAFCIWDGGRLPTEAEWNFAAAGGDEQRVLPWSDPPNLTTIGETYASYYVDETRQCGGDGMNGCAPTDIVFVGTKKDGYGRFHQADMAGNVWEWTQDTFAPYSAECVDCAALGDGNRVGRGGGYISNVGLLRTESRVGFSPTYRSSAFGVRCARDDSGG